jgi:hypothetical protein
LAEYIIKHTLEDLLSNIYLKNEKKNEPGPCYHNNSRLFSPTQNPVGIVFYANAQISVFNTK